MNIQDSKMFCINSQNHLNIEFLVPLAELK